MVTHIVMWKLKDEAEGGSRDQNAAQMKLRVERNVMPGGFDLCLVGEYQDLEALKLYRDHPLHKEVQQFVHKVITDRASCDYEA